MVPDVPAAAAVEEEVVVLGPVLLARFDPVDGCESLM